MRAIDAALERGMRVVVEHGKASLVNPAQGAGEVLAEVEEIGVLSFDELVGRLERKVCRFGVDALCEA